MAFNPFIELFREPVATLAWLGYFLSMVAIVAVAGPWSIRQTAWLVARYRKNRRSDAWWSFGDNPNGYIPPTDWLWHLFWVIITLSIVAWALGTVVWLVGG